jgi:hypothetical protein
MYHTKDLPSAMQKAFAEVSPDRNELVRKIRKIRLEVIE